MRLKASALLSAIVLLGVVLIVTVPLLHRFADWRAAYQHELVWQQAQANQQYVLWRDELAHSAVAGVPPEQPLTELTALPTPLR